MHLEDVRFRGVSVGLHIVADTPEERVLLRALANLPAVPDTAGSAPCARLALEPRLPWDNLQEPQTA
jgi:hypothetical protein